ncbi:hypothetical protein V1277_006067 [Bradyrhizobium sp. AZCC 1588]
MAPVLPCAAAMGWTTATPVNVTAAMPQLEPWLWRD